MTDKIGKTTNPGIYGFYAPKAAKRSLQSDNFCSVEIFKLPEDKQAQPGCLSWLAGLVSGFVKSLFTCIGSMFSKSSKVNERTPLKGVAYLRTLKLQYLPREEKPSMPKDPILAQYQARIAGSVVKAK